MNAFTHGGTGSRFPRVRWKLLAIQGLGLLLVECLEMLYARFIQSQDVSYELGAHRNGLVADCGLSHGSRSARLNPFGHAIGPTTRARAVETPVFKLMFAGKGAA
jgi:hypothetical protein